MTLLPPPSKENEKVSSQSGGLESTVVAAAEMVPFKGLPLVGARKRRKQRDNPRLAVVVSLPPVDPTQEHRVKRKRDQPVSAVSDSSSTGN